MGLLTPRRRAERERVTEALADSLIASGAAGSYGGEFPGEDMRGYRQLGVGRREVPSWSLEKARTMSVHAYRVNPMAKAILDTYTAFAVGASGVRPHSPDPKVKAVLDAVWTHPRNQLSTNDRQELLLRSHMIYGETALELLVNPIGRTFLNYIDPTGIDRIELDAGNPLWPSTLVMRSDVGGQRLPLVQFDEFTGLSEGRAMFWPDWRAIMSDTRGYPFLASIIDWLDGYDRTVWNLIDRTALARYLVFDVTVEGGPAEIDAWIAQRGSDPPKSGSMEVHNNKVTIEPKTAQMGAYEDKQTAQLAMTNIAAGAGLAKTWLAEPEDANKATSVSMAEPVRRRVSGVQGLWLAHMTELLQFVVERHVAAGKLRKTSTLTKAGGGTVRVTPSSTVSVTGPEIAATDAQVNANILITLSQGLATMAERSMLSDEAIRIAARKAWEEYVGVPYDPALDRPDADPQNLADYIDDTSPADESLSLRLVGGKPA